jgi:membrane peptidoglycan carboxypeptidase
LNALTIFISRLVEMLLPRDSQRLSAKLKSAYERYRRGCTSGIPEVLVSALVVAEDHRFYLHRGVDPIAILRAIWHSCRQRRLVGGSTIEQQLVRTLTGRKERCIKRKLKELALSLCVQRYVPKSGVPGLYLSVAYFGHGMNGIQQACARLRIDDRVMTARQAAALVARLKYPEPSNPTTGRICQISLRGDYILGRLYSVLVQDRVYAAELATGVTDDEALLCNR